MSERVVLKQIQIGPMGNYCYILGSKEQGEAAIVDPGWDPDRIMHEVQSLGLSITHIFITHAHFDHTNALLDVMKKCDAKVYVSEHEKDFKPTGKHIIKVKDRDVVSVGGITCVFLHTPGHSPGSMCILTGNNLISGDTLFIDGVGRCDLSGGDPEVMFHTLQNIIMPLPDNILIYPGHSYHEKLFDTLGNQKKTNPYLQHKSLEEFLKI